VGRHLKELAAPSRGARQALAACIYGATGGILFYELMIKGAKVAAPVVVCGRTGTTWNPAGRRQRPGADGANLFSNGGFNCSTILDLVP
jgi:hypothetical protein